MHTPRYCSAAVVLSGSLFVIGGVDEQRRRLSSVEYYMPLTDSWHTVSSMRHARYWAAASVLNGFIFVFGGLNNANRAIQSIERYDPRDDSWTEVI